MRRYVVRRAEYDPAGWSPLLPHLVVYEPDDAPRSIGLFDHHGNELMAVDEREPIGFVRLRER